MSKSIGALEFQSISKGMYIADAIVKKADVEILYFRTICPGKFLVIISGDEDAIDEAIDCGEDLAEKTLVDSFRVHNVSPEIIDGFRNRYNRPSYIDAVGIIETRKVCTGIRVLDLVLKAADVSLIKIYMAFAIGGKLVFLVTGSVSSIEYAFQEGKSLLSEYESANIAIIPSPSEEVLQQLVFGKKEGNE
ncbi:BMC domain-containing protein [Anaerosporobacter faecicola]|uniref:BMC domain-containing protein n=1 Tax=Anaerosporobacter faecicola TaxID=2718714 RepID=UPI001438EE6F|nr:BMC domain-containing protein [Anaerosporobacter faecicola]